VGIAVAITVAHPAVPSNYPLIAAGVIKTEQAQPSGASTELLDVYIRLAYYLHLTGQFGGLPCCHNRPPLEVVLTLAAIFGLAAAVKSQESVGPQTSAPPAVTPSHKREPAPNGEKISVPAGTRLAVVLENGISTRSAKAGDSL